MLDNYHGKYEIKEDEILEEQLARYVQENTEDLSLINRIYLWVKRFLRDLGLPLFYSKNDIIYMFTSNIRLMASYVAHSPDNDILNFISPEAFSPLSRGKHGVRVMNDHMKSMFKQVVVNKTWLHIQNTDQNIRLAASAGVTKNTLRASNVFESLKDNVSEFSQRLYNLARPIILMREVYPKLYKNFNEVIEIATKYRFDFMDRDWKKLSDQERAEHLQIFKETDHGYVVEKIERGQKLWDEVIKNANVDDIMKPVNLYKSVRKFYKHLNGVMIKALKDAAQHAHETGVLITRKHKQNILTNILNESIDLSLANEIERLKLRVGTHRGASVSFDTFKEKVSAHLKEDFNLRLSAVPSTIRKVNLINLKWMAAKASYLTNTPLNKKSSLREIADFIMDNNIKAGEKEIVNRLTGFDETLKETLEDIDKRVKEGIKPYFPSIHIGDFGLNYKYVKGENLIIRMQETFHNVKEMAERREELRRNPDHFKEIQEFNNTSGYNTPNTPCLLYTSPSPRDS